MGSGVTAPPLRALPAPNPSMGIVTNGLLRVGFTLWTEQAFVPPGDGFASDSDNPVHKITCSVPLRPEVNTRGPNQVVPRSEKSDGLRPRRVAESQGTKSLVIQSSLNYIVIFNLFFATLPLSPERIRHLALLSSAAEKGIL